MRARTFLLSTALVALSASIGYAQTRTADHYVPSRPENLTWGWFPVDARPVVTVQSGQTVRVDTISHQGSTQDENPVTFLGALGVKPEEILGDVRDFWASRPARSRADGRTGVHVLTGPIAVAGAEAGDMLEVQILELRPRVPYGLNTPGMASSVLGAGYPGIRPGDRDLNIPATTRHLIRTGVVNGREVAIFSDTIHVPLAPFMGTLAVAPAAGIQSSGPPGSYGGNMDLKALTVGSTLYLPVFQHGALFYAGDPHGAQGDGEVSGNALEQSLTAVFRFVLHKGMTIAGPRAETPTHFILMGIDRDLNRAMRKATLEVVDFLVKEKGLTPAKAFSLASIAVDFHIAEAVDDTQVVAGKIPKSLFGGP